MGQITVIKKNGTRVNLFSKEPFRTVKSATQAYTLMGDDSVQLSVQSSEMMDFEIGDKIIIGGDEYSVRTKTTRGIEGEDHYTYDVAFYGVMYELMKTLYRNAGADGKSSKNTFDLTYNLHDLVKVIIYNLDRDYPGLWVFDADNCPGTDPIAFQFSKQNCLQVLQNVCKEFGYEFRIDQENGIRIIRVGKFGSVITPPNGSNFFEYGKGSGLYKLKEQKIDDKSIITRLWVEGGTKNIRSNYREYSDRLQLPLRRLNRNQHTLSDGTVIPPLSEYIGIATDDDRFIEDTDLKNRLGSIEDVEQNEEIHPKRTGTVTALGGDIYSFVDDTMDFDLTEKDPEGNTKWLIGGNSAKLTFITGKMAGQECELKEKSGYNHAAKTFSIIKYTDERGLSIPTADSEAFRIQVGDKYKLTDINLPDAYVDNAEEELWYWGYDKFLDRKQPRAQYVLTFDRNYFISTLPDDSETSVFRIGDYIPVRDERFNLEKNIRIQKLTRNLMLEQDYTLTLSDITTISVQSQIVQDVLEHNIIIEANRLRDISKARRGWRTTEELRNMVYDPDGYFDNENIKPNSIDTNMLSVGSKSQQFILVDVILEANVNGLPNRFDASAGKLVHLTIDENAARIWNMGATTVTLTENDGYYVFAKCSKAGSNGVFFITQQQLKPENTDDPNNYYFQVGVIGSLHPTDNFRDFTTTYGFTRINGNTITTGVIKSGGGSGSYIDLDDDRYRIGNNARHIAYNENGDGQLKLRGSMVQSPSGDTNPLTAPRGDWSNSLMYYAGDEVFWNGSTWRCVLDTPSAGIMPINSTYWKQAAAKGANGLDGINGKDGNDGLSVVWQGDSPNPPSNPQKNWAYRDTDNGVVYIYNGTAWALMVADGSDGEAGAKGNDGNSVFITYHDNATTSKPAKPTGNGTTGGWHTAPSSTCVWMSQKVALNASLGEWGEPIMIQGEGIGSLEIGGTNLVLSSKLREFSGSIELCSSLVVGREYTLSIAKSTSVRGEQTKMLVYNYNRGLADYRAMYINFGLNKSITFTATGNMLDIYSGTQWSGGYVARLEKVKLEKGNKATDWSPAPEDVQAEIDNIQVGGRNYALDTSNDRIWRWWGDHKVSRFLLSKDIKDKDVDITITFMIKSVSGSSSGGIGFGSSTAWNNVYFWYPQSVVGKQQMIIRKPAGVSAIWYYTNEDTTVSNFSVQTGNKVIDWAPAPEDMLNHTNMYQGAYIQGRAYSNNGYRQDIVKYGSAWYKYIGTNGQTQGSWNSANWEPFGASFESVATGYLWAEGANLAEFEFDNGAMASQEKMNSKPKIYLNGRTGKAGFLDVEIEGTQRNPFVLWDSGRNVFNGDAVNVKRDNVVMPISSTTIYENGFSWGAENSGRIIRLVHYKWDYSTSYGYVTLKAPTGKFFYENGVAYTQINTSRETVELLGYGTPTQFYGWIVLSRVNTMTDGNYGANKKVIYQGIFNPSYKDLMERTWSASLEATGIDEVWNVAKLGEGHYKIWLPIYLATTAYHVGLTSCMYGMTGAISSNSANVYACLVNKGYDGSKGVSFFEVKTADDASINDGGFYFEVIGTYNWSIPSRLNYAVRSMSLLSDNSEPETETPDIITFSTHYNH